MNYNNKKKNAFGFTILIINSKEIMKEELTKKINYIQYKIKCPQSSSFIPSQTKTGFCTELLQ